jgi:hypothetical protein
MHIVTFELIHIIYCQVTSIISTQDYLLYLVHFMIWKNPNLKYFQCRIAK